MQMNTPAPRNALDDNRQGLMGKPVDRVEGRLNYLTATPAQSLSLAPAR